MRWIRGDFPLGGIQAICTLPEKEGRFAPLTLTAASSRQPVLANLTRKVREFIDDELSLRQFRPESDAWLSGIDLAFNRRSAERGWVGMTLPVRYGGHGRSEIELFAVNEEQLAAGAPVTAHWIPTDRPAAV
jgi:alkylation response protein AidB-like acyl-CoA dehydrogenase